MGSALETEPLLKFCALGALLTSPLVPALSLDPTLENVAVDSGGYPGGLWMPPCLGP